MHLLLLDNFDSFTFNLLDYFQQLGVSVEVVRNDVPLEVIRQLRFDAIVLSPGPGTPARAGCLLDVVREYHHRVPMLGVCLGHQALGEFFGAHLTRAARPMHGKVSEVAWTEADPLFAGLPRQFRVTRYHSLIINLLPPDLRPLAYTTDPAHELMVFRHRTYPLYGVQFHPEALLTAHGLALLRNWVKCCIIAKDGHSALAGREIPREDGIAD
ncbi:aminodeoxychorismate/anthranilate synthase component II [Hymenobacter aquaticus]|uniref:Aminodeoxychorismate/anthranilate synthase component II n=1 Tax=Hymenobacter aquaticus TaxID=1867101 RepID=A0A4Z0PRS1_9BACT|nr:aminodeoxychorismate/anthranilate synthase component II [Hymenobacter aquaticus]TGE20358.1 aminodeoxychorismate/anthranilate synthase component II [Hymenobacter aquaticus]